MKAQKLQKSAVPLYHQLGEILRKQIANNEIIPNQLLPTEMELCDLFGVSRATVRQAIKNLEDDGLIERIQGRGTIVVDHQTAQRNVKLFGTVNDLISLGLTTYLEFESKRLVVPPAELVKDGCFPKNEKAYLFKGKRFVQKPGRFKMIVHFYLPKPIGTAITVQQFSGKGSVIEDIEGIAGKKTQRIRQEISALPANRHMADGLNIDIGDPLLRLKRALLADDNSLLLCGLTYIHYKHFSYPIELVLF